MRPGMAVVGALLALALVGGPAAAQGDPPGYGPHTDHLGLHWILDSAAPEPGPELPAVQCAYGGSSLRLKLLKIRQPVLLANKAEGFHSQRVGWQAIVEASDDLGGPWTRYAASSWTKTTATAPWPADLAPKQVSIGSDVLDHDYYRVLYKLRWYKANGTEAGTAIHWPTWYGVTSSLGTWRIADACPNSMIPLAGASPAGASGELEHAGKRGPHWILDNPGPEPEFPAATCVYDSAYQLDSVEVRRPMILARDSGPGTQAQDVRWRVLLQTTPTNSGTETWTTLKQTGWSRARATELSWAKLQPKTVDVTPMVDVIAIRVVYELQWYRGSSNEVIGRAKHAPLVYLLRLSSGNTSYHGATCYTDALP